MGNDNKTTYSGNIKWPNHGCTIPNYILISLSIMYLIIGVDTNDIINLTLSEIDVLKPGSNLIELQEHWRKCCLFCVKFDYCHKNCMDYTYNEYMVLGYITKQIQKSQKCLRLCYTTSIRTKSDEISKSTTSIRMKDENITKYTEITSKIILIIVAAIIMLAIPIIYCKRKKKILRNTRMNYTKPPNHESLLFREPEEISSGTELKYLKPFRTSIRSCHSYFDNTDIYTNNFSSFKRKTNEIQPTDDTYSSQTSDDRTTVRETFRLDDLYKDIYKSKVDRQEVAIV